MASTTLSYIGYICSHRDLVYYFVNKRKNSGYMYRFFFSLWTLFFVFAGRWERWEKCSFLFVGSAIENVILRSQKEFCPHQLSLPRSDLKSAVLPLHSHQTARDKTCEQIEQILTPLPSAAPNSMKLGYLTNLIPFTFAGRHSGVL